LKKKIKGRVAKNAPRTRGGHKNPTTFAKLGINGQGRGKDFQKPEKKKIASGLQQIKRERKKKQPNQWGGGGEERGRKTRAPNDIRKERGKKATRRRNSSNQKIRVRGAKKKIWQSEGQERRTIVPRSWGPRKGQGEKRGKNPGKRHHGNKLQKATNKAHGEKKNGNIHRNGGGPLKTPLLQQNAQKNDQLRKKKKNIEEKKKRKKKSFHQGKKEKGRKFRHKPTEKRKKKR